MKGRNMVTAEQLLNTIFDTLDDVEKRQKENYIADGKAYHLAERNTTQLIRQLIMLEADHMGVERREYDDIFKDLKIITS